MKSAKNNPSFLPVGRVQVKGEWLQGLVLTEWLLLLCGRDFSALRIGDCVPVRMASERGRARIIHVRCFGPPRLDYAILEVDIAIGPTSLDLTADRHFGESCFTVGWNGSSSGGLHQVGQIRDFVSSSCHYLVKLDQQPPNLIPGTPILVKTGDPGAPRAFAFALDVKSEQGSNVLFAESISVALESSPQVCDPIRSADLSSVRSSVKPTGNKRIFDFAFADAAPSSHREVFFQVAAPLVSGELGHEAALKVQKRWGAFTDLLRKSSRRLEWWLGDASGLLIARFWHRQVHPDEGWASDPELHENLTAQDARSLLATFDFSSQVTQGVQTGLWVPPLYTIGEEQPDPASLRVPLPVEATSETMVDRLFTSMHDLFLDELVFEASPFLRRIFDTETKRNEFVRAKFSFLKRRGALLYGLPYFGSLGEFRPGALTSFAVVARSGLNGPMDFLLFRELWFEFLAEYLFERSVSFQELGKASSLVPVPDLQPLLERLGEEVPGLKGQLPSEDNLKHLLDSFHPDVGELCALAIVIGKPLTRKERWDLGTLFEVSGKLKQKKIKFFRENQISALYKWRKFVAIVFFRAGS